MVNEMDFQVLEASVFVLEVRLEDVCRCLCLLVAYSQYLVDIRFSSEVAVQSHCGFPLRKQNAFTITVTL
jgi:hypothetical protein